MPTKKVTAEDRVRKHTAPEVNRALDASLAARIRLYAKADQEQIDRRLDELDREWDMERLLQTNAATLALSGTLLGILGSKKWLILPTMVTGFLLQHAIQGWCPPVPAFRRLGVRTRLEIEKERYALKALRGDFKGSGNGDSRNSERVMRSLEK